MGRPALIATADVIALVREGLTDRQIAMRFGVSRQAVAHHRRNFGIVRDEAARREQMRVGTALASEGGYDPADSCGEVRNCAPGAWEAALGSNRFHDAPPWVLDTETYGSLPHREISTGQSSMAYL